MAIRAPDGANKLCHTAISNTATAGIWCATELYISKCKKRIISSVSVCAGDNMFEATDLCVGLISVLTVLIFVFVFVIGTCLCFFNSLCAPLCVWHRQCSSGKPSRERNSVYSLLHLVSICRACFNICIPRFFFFY